MATSIHGPRLNAYKVEVLTAQGYKLRSPGLYEKRPANHLFDHPARGSMVAYKETPAGFEFASWC